MGVLRRFSRPVLVAATLACSFGFAAPRPVGADHVQVRIDAHDPVDCAETTPAAIEVPVASDSAPTLEVLVLVDGLAVPDAAALLARTAEPYRALGIEMMLTYRVEAFAGDGEHPWRDATKATIEGRALIADARARLGGKRPAEFDLVYVLTSKDLWSGDSEAPESGRDYSEVGIADCIGGIRYDDRSFAVGETLLEGSVAGLRFSPDGTSTVAAHELGHLLGGQHHYAVCGLGASNVADGNAGVCSLMWPELSTASFEFSPVNASIVLGHARDH